MDKILQAYVGRTQISRVKIWATWAKEAQDGGEKVGVFFGKDSLPKTHPLQ